MNVIEVSDKVLVRKFYKAEYLLCNLSERKVRVEIVESDDTQTFAILLKSFEE